MLLVDKPAGITSHDVVGAARRALRQRRIGHAGTLDPFATGLLVLMIGRATRLLPYVSGEPKVYEATVRFGAETTTDDLTGDVVREAPVPSEAAVARALPALTGAIDQVPPAFSAKKVEGQRAYDAARRGIPVVLGPSSVVVHRWDLVRWSGEELDVKITCGGGTYIRALARDLGRLTGSAAHVTRLRRTASGVFDLAAACTLDDVRSGAARLLPAVAAVPEMPTRTLDTAERERICRGQPIPAGDARPGRFALVDATGDLVAIAEQVGDALHPRVVLRVD